MACVRMRNVCIWGIGDLGIFVMKQINRYFRNWNISYIIDSNKEKCEKIQGDIKTPDVLMEDGQNVDILIITSVRYIAIADIAIDTYHIKKEKIIYVNTKWPKRLKMNPSILWEKLYFRSYMPDNHYLDELMKELSKEEGELNCLGIKYKTDKASIMVEKDAFRLSHDYLRHYDKAIGRGKENVSSLCELGCGQGASLKMWKEYFPQAVVIGVDINPAAKRFEEERIEIVIGNAASLDTIAALGENYEKFSVIIDDASHAWGDMRVSFENLWDYLASGGLYIIEDTCCGSQGSFPDYPPKVWDSQSIFDYVMDRTKIMSFCPDWNPEFNKYHFEHLPKQIQKIERELDDVLFIHGAVIIRKR